MHIDHFGITVGLLPYDLKVVMGLNPGIGLFGCRIKDAYIYPAWTLLGWNIEHWAALLIHLFMTYTYLLFVNFVLYT